MKKRTPRWGCLFAVLLILVLLIGGVWWYFRIQRSTTQGSPVSPVQVFLLSPSSGDQVSAGDYVQVSVQATAPQPITNAELFVDGQSLGAISDSPESASWSWQAWPVGVHTFFARATAADGQVGQSQTVILNVLLTSDAFQIPAGGGETLAQIGEKFGVPPDQMADANPHVDPSAPLKDGQPVNVPVGGGAGGGSPQPPGGGGNAGGGGFPLTIVWELKLTKPADNSYCYLSAGDGIWDKIPQPPFNFFQSLDNLYTQVFDAIPSQGVDMQAECWGWLGGALQFLGKGGTKFDPQSAPVQLVVNAAGFQLTGSPQYKPLGGGGPPTIPPPYALREPANTADCAAHDLLAGFICQTLLNQTLKQYMVLEWEWQPALSFPGSDSFNTIDGYDVYEIEHLNIPFVKFMKEVTSEDAKVAMLPLPFGPVCYGVRAFANAPQYGGKIYSDMDMYCPGQALTTQQITLTPSDWLTTGGDWINVDCPFELPPYTFANEPAVAVGSYIVDDGDCFEQGDYSGGVQFSLAPLPSGAVIQKAVLKFSKVLMEWSATGKALGPAPQSCVSAIGMSKQDWSGLNTGDHFSSTNLRWAAYYQPFTSISAWMNPSVDVTPIAINWLNHPQNNHGFILVPIEAPEPDEGTGKCISGLGDFQLVIDYFTP